MHESLTYHLRAILLLHVIGLRSLKRSLAHAQWGKVNPLAILAKRRFWQNIRLLRFFTFFVPAPLAKAGSSPSPDLVQPVTEPVVSTSRRSRAVTEAVVPSLAGA